jgi:hypothetical protein
MNCLLDISFIKFVLSDCFIINRIKLVNATMEPAFDANSSKIKLTKLPLFLTGST